MSDILDVFQPGLIRGAANLPYDPAKRYFYVEHPVEGWRVYLRACCFIHENGKELIKSKFLVVKRTGGRPNGPTWEPPKGQMEGKDGMRHPEASVLGLLAENVRREVAEEAKVYSLEGLRHTGLVLQAVEPDFPPNTFFQYHVFQGFASPETLAAAFQEFEWIREHPAAFKRFRRDKREKDALAWYHPRKTRLMGRWSPGLVAQYLAAA
jgi:8-oxo-dGTP pyrophosphatase MutT (NUDIX family)